MVPLPQIQDDRLHYWFSYNAVILDVLVDAGAIVMVIGYVIVLGLYNETEWMLFDRELIIVISCNFVLTNGPAIW